MSFLLDTDTCSAQLRGDPAVDKRCLQYTGRLHVSAVTLAELTIWLYRRNTPNKYWHAYLSLRKGLTVIAVEEPIAAKAGEVGADLMDRGLSMAIPDLLIAATALVHNLILVTHNTQDFIHVPGLSLVDWTVP